MSRLALFALVALALLPLSACASRNIYELPPPPAEQDRRTVSLIPGEEERQAERDYLEARAAMIQLNSFLRAKRFEESLAMMSQETRAMLAFVSPAPDAPKPELMALSQGKVQINGQVREVEPAAMLLAPELTNIKDSIEGTQEQETQRRKEIFALQPDGSARKIVVIKEGNQWVLHRTTLDQIK